MDAASSVVSGRSQNLTSLNRFCRTIFPASRSIMKKKKDEFKISLKCFFDNQPSLGFSENAFVYITPRSAEVFLFKFKTLESDQGWLLFKKNFCLCAKQLCCHVLSFFAFDTVVKTISFFRFHMLL